MVSKLKIYQTNSHDSGPLRRKREVLIRIERIQDRFTTLHRCNKIVFWVVARAGYNTEQVQKYRYDRRKQIRLVVVPKYQALILPGLARRGFRYVLLVCVELCGRGEEAAWTESHRYVCIISNYVILIRNDMLYLNVINLS